MKNILVAFFIALVLFSCQENRTKPDPFIEEPKMEDILYDISLLYGAQNTNSFVIDTIREVKMEDIFKKYDIDSVTFAANSRYYLALKKGVYFNLQTRVMDRLKKEQEKINSLKEEGDKVPELVNVKDTLKAVAQDTVSTTEWKLKDERKENKGEKTEQLKLKQIKKEIAE